MIFNGGNIDRLNYAVSKVLEFDGFLIINGETYDKTTLFKVSDFLVEYGLGYGSTFFQKFFQTSWFSSGTFGGQRGATQTSFITNYLRDRSKLCGSLSVFDNQNPDLIHIIAGETCIKLNTLTMKYEVARNKVPAFSVLNCAFLHQNDEYIYFLSQYIGSSDKLSNGCHYIMVYNKRLMRFDYKGGYGTLNTAYALNLIHKENQYCFLSAAIGGVLYLYKIECAGDNPAVTSMSFVQPANYAKVVTMCPVASATDKNGIFYKLCNLYKLSYERLENQTLIDSGLETLLTDDSPINVDDCLMEKYELDSIDEDTRKSYMPMVTSNSGVQSGVGGRLWECMLVDDDQYLVIQHTVCNANVNPTNNDWIAIFRRNNEDNPFDLTMTDFLRFSELDRMEQPCKHFAKVTETLLAAVSNNVTYQLEIRDGKFVESHIFIPNLYAFGYDKTGRYYYTQATNDDLNIESQTYPSRVELSYTKSTDAFVEYDNSIVKRDVIVTTLNKNGAALMGNFELYSTSARFANNSLIYRGKTDASGQAIVPISFNGAFDCVITGKILQENEL